MKQEVKIGQTDYSSFILVRDTSGNAKTGLAYTDIDLAYARMETDNDATTTDVAPATLASLTAAHSDWGFLEVSATDHPGLYRLDYADAVFASGAWSAVVSLTGTGLEPSHCEFVLTPESPYNGVDVYSVAGTAQTANDNGADINDILTDTGSTLDTLIKDIPTVAEFNARTLASADYITTADITGVEVDNDGTAISLAGAFKLILGVLTGKASGGGTTTVTFRDIADSKDRVVATVDANGNRTAIGTRDAT